MAAELESMRLKEAAKVVREVLTVQLDKEVHSDKQDGQNYNSSSINGQHRENPGR